MINPEKIILDTKLLQDESVAKDCRDRFTTMLELGHIAMVDSEIKSPLKIRKAVGITKEGEDFLNCE